MALQFLGLFAFRKKQFSYLVSHFAFAKSNKCLTDTVCTSDGYGDLRYFASSLLLLLLLLCAHSSVHKTNFVSCGVIAFAIKTTHSNRNHFRSFGFFGIIRSNYYSSAIGIASSVAFSVLSFPRICRLSNGDWMDGPWAARNQIYQNVYLFRRGTNICNGIKTGFTQIFTPDFESIGSAMAAFKQDVSKCVRLLRLQFRWVL